MQARRCRCSLFVAIPTLIMPSQSTSLALVTFWKLVVAPLNVGSVSLRKEKEEVPTRGHNNCRFDYKPASSIS